MFEAFLIFSALMSFAIFARLLSPPIEQLQKEFDEAETLYSKDKGVVSGLGLVVNRLHFMIIRNRAAIISVLLLCWLTSLFLWLQF